MVCQHPPPPSAFHYFTELVITLKECCVLSGEKSTVTIEPEWAYGRKGKPEVLDLSARLPASFELALTCGLRVPGWHRAQRDADLRYGAGGHPLMAPRLTTALKPAPCRAAAMEFV